ncbi:MAG: ATP-binding cassette domain-containing protein [Anaerolineae bacterium]|jgi:ABC-type nitrate/sulfonate/bicarbonate transport system ATPase subunit|nr:ATP-binding cassette domain-containing protein [Anaerolineae bacterium]
MITIENLTFRYGARGALVFQDFNWHVKPGEAWSIIGSSGCGKTTLLMLIAGLRRATRGTIRVGNTLIQRPRPETGLILQDYGLLPWASVWDNVALGLRVRRFYGPDGKHAPRYEARPSRQQTQQIVDSWLYRLHINEQRDKFPGAISGGQRQRTAIARTLALQPDLLLMDEPFSSLDAPTREDLQTLVLSLQAEMRLTSVIVTHAIEEAAILGRHILVLSALPNTDTVIVSNPDAGTPGYRSTQTFLDKCNELRLHLGLKP